MARIFALWILGFALAAKAQGAVAWLEGPDLNGAQHSLPQELSGTPAVLVFGFTNDSKHATQPWVEALWAAQAARGGFQVYLVALLERAPGFVMPMIKSGLRKRYPKEKQGHVLILRKGTEQWEQALAYDKAQAPDHAYLAVLGRNGDVIWKGRGDANAAPRDEVDAALAKALKRGKP